MKRLKVPKSRPPWQSVMQNAEEPAWFPLFFDRSLQGDREAMDELLERREVSFVHDTIEAQLGDLMKTRSPHVPAFEPGQLARLVEEKLGDVAMYDYGRWAFFPWSRRLVHLVPPDEFFELRSDRNRQKITRAEQLKLSRLKVGLVGLSVGNAIAVTLALEGLFGELRLADFDELDLSNMNRIRCGVHQIGVNKAVLCAQQIFEQNPYANLVLYTEGFTKENVESFIEEGGRLDVMIDECDSIYAKVRIREESRARRIPVLMETSDRGMLDIERFDQEPKRPILHGLLGNLRAEDVEALPPPARIGLVLRVVGQDTMSARAAASMLELGRTIRAFSQLGSDVTLGGATTAIAVRRIGLGMPLKSGRVYIDVTQMLSSVSSPSLPVAVDARWKREVAFIHQIVEKAVLAPSRANSQPWRFTYSHEVFRVWLDRTRLPPGEIHEAWGWIAVGAALENIHLTASALGRSVAMALFPNADKEPELVAELRFEAADKPKDEDPLFEQIAKRVTNCKLGNGGALSPMHAQVMMEAARANGAKLQMCLGRASLDDLAGILGEADRLQILSPKLHEEQMREIRWTEADATHTRDGLALHAMELSPMDLAVYQMVRHPDVASVLRLIRGGEVLMARAANAVRSSAALGYLTIPGTGPESYVRGGRALQQVWLTAMAFGLSVQPYNSPIELFARVEHFNGEGLTADEVSAVLDLRERFVGSFSVALSNVGIALLRFSYADPPTTRSLRRHVDDVLRIDGPPVE